MNLFRIAKFGQKLFSSAEHAAPKLLGTTKRGIRVYEQTSPDRVSKILSSYKPGETTPFKQLLINKGYLGYGSGPKVVEMCSISENALCDVYRTGNYYRSCVTKAIDDSKALRTITNNKGEIVGKELLDSNLGVIYREGTCALDVTKGKFNRIEFVRDANGFVKKTIYTDLKGKRVFEIYQPKAGTYTYHYEQGAIGGDPSKAIKKTFYKRGDMLEITTQDSKTGKVLHNTSKNIDRRYGYDERLADVTNNFLDAQKTISQVI